MARVPAAIWSSGGLRLRGLLCLSGCIHRNHAFDSCLRDHLGKPRIENARTSSVSVSTNDILISPDALLISLAAIEQMTGFLAIFLILPLSEHVDRTRGRSSTDRPGLRATITVNLDLDARLCKKWADQDDFGSSLVAALFPNFSNPHTNSRTGREL
jgi:hypothetical protein